MWTSHHLVENWEHRAGHSFYCHRLDTVGRGSAKATTRRTTGTNLRLVMNQTVSRLSNHQQERRHWAGPTLRQCRRQNQPRAIYNNWRGAGFEPRVFTDRNCESRFPADHLSVTTGQHQILTPEQLIILIPDVNCVFWLTAFELSSNTK